MPQTGAILQQVVDVGVRLVGARYGALGVVNARGDTLARFLTAGAGDPSSAAAAASSAEVAAKVGLPLRRVEEARAAIGSLPQGQGLLGAFIRDPRPLRLRDFHEDPRSAGFPAGHPPAGSFLGFPLFSSGKVCGSLYFIGKLGPPEFRAADERLAENLARLADQAIENPAAHPEVRRSLDFLRSAVEEGAGAVIITNPAREIILWNEGAGDLFGYTEEEALGRRIEELLVPGEEREEWRMSYVRQHVRALQAGRTVRFETTRLQKDGGEIPVGVALSPILSGSAGIMAITGVYQITRA